MKGFLLDTNVLSEFSRTGKPNPGVSIWMRSASPDSLFDSVLTFAEILRGIELLPSGKRRVELREWLERDLEDAFNSRLPMV